MTRSITLLAALVTALAAGGCPPPSAPSRAPARPTRPLAKVSFQKPKAGPATAEIVATKDRTIVVSFVDDGKAGVTARYAAIDAAARVRWTARHHCPAKGEPLRLFASARLVICKGSKGLSALSLADGKPAWSWSAEGKLYITRVVADRVVTSDANRRLVVLDAATGEVRRRFALDGSPLEAVAQTDRGLLAYVVKMEQSRPRALIAQRLDGPDKGDRKPAPLAPLWSVPFDQASSYAVDVVGAQVLAWPRAGLLAAYDAATGKRRWRAPAATMGRIVFGETLLLTSGSFAGGTAFVAGLDPATRHLRWIRRWPEPSPPPSLGENHGVVFCGSRARWRLYRASDGGALAGGAVTKRTVVGVAADHATVFGDVEGARRVEVIRLGGDRAPAPVKPLPSAPARPPWIKAGARLVYELRLKGRDPQRFEVFIRSRKPAVVYNWRAGDGRRGVRVIPEQVLATATRHSDLYGKLEGHRRLDVTSLWVSRKVYAALTRQGKIAWHDASAGGRATLAREGRGIHRARRRPWLGDVSTLDIPVLVARGGSSRYWIAEHAEHPLLVRAVHEGFEVHLTEIIPPRPGAGVDISALKWPPPCSAKKGGWPCLAEARNLERRGAVDGAYLLAAWVAAKAAKRRGDRSLWSAAQALVTRLRTVEFLRWPSLIEQLTAACKRSPEACLALAELYTGAEAPKAVEVLEPLCARRRDLRACLALGELYTRGRGTVRAAPKKAAALFDRICKRGHMLGCVALGALVAQGKGTDRDLGRAAKLWQRACDREAYLGCVARASYALRGEGTTRDEKRALALLQRACGGREIQACYLLGMLHMRGKIEGVDKTKAAPALAKACDDGHGASCLVLAHLYREGQGVAPDKRKARDLMRRACDGGVRRACRWLHQPGGR